MLATELAQPDLRVLVVDDNVDAATSLSVLLQLLGCQTAVAFDGTTGVHLAGLFRPHLAFFDLDMPGLDGCAAIELLRAGGEHQNTVFICLTGRSDSYDEDRCLKAGFDHFTSKPLELEVLSALLTSRTRLARSAGRQTG